MITKAKTKVRPNTKSKLLVFGLLLLILAGLFAPIFSVKAQSPDGKGTCFEYVSSVGIWQPTNRTEAQCKTPIGSTQVTYRWEPASTTTLSQNLGLCVPPGSNGTITLTGSNPYNSTELTCRGSWDGTKIIQAGKIVSKNATTGTIYSSTPVQPKTDTNGDGIIDEKDATPAGATPGEAQNSPNVFGSCTDFTKLTLSSCLLAISYNLLLVPSSYILWLTAYLFNSMLALTLGTALYDNNFLPEAWRIIRDFSNIFFILVLLYIAIKMIVGLGQAEGRRMIVNVIIAALLINFSMFMTKVVIDSSNILALIFYNKIDIRSEKSIVAGGSEGVSSTGTPYSSVWSSSKEGVVQDKDIAGGIVTGFDITKFINPLTTKDLEAAVEKKTTGQCLADNYGKVGVSAAVSPIAAPIVFAAFCLGGSEGTLAFGPGIAIVITGTLVFLFAAWAFFIAGLAFIGRLVELWALIIFSPFAFMSFSIEKLKGVKYIGFDEWSHSLLKTAFMAPIFMFFLLLISKIVSINILANIQSDVTGKKSIFHILFMLALPAIIYLTMLNKATKYAKEGAGEFAGAVVKYGKMAGAVVGGLALGAATGGVGLAAGATLGRAGSAIANSSFAKNNGVLGRGIGNVGKWLGGSSFDLRKAPGVGSLLQKAGIKTEASSLTKAMGLSTEGGFEKRRAEKIKARQERAKSLEVGEDEHLKQVLNNLEYQKQGLLRDVSHDIEQLENRIKIWRERAKDSNDRVNALRNAGVAATAPEFIAAIAAGRTASDNLQELKDHRLAIKNGTDFTPTAVSAINPAHAGHLQTYSTSARVMYNGALRSINDFEDTLIPHAHHEIERENRNRKWAYANQRTQPRGRFMRALRFIGTGGQYDARAEREAAHKIIMEDKLESKDKH